MTTTAGAGDVRILHVAFDLFSVGGIQRYTRYVLRAIHERCGAAAVDVCSLRPRSGDGFGQDLVVEVTGRGTSLVAKASFMWSLLRHAHAQRPTVVVCDHVVLAPIARLVARRAGVPWYLHVYGLEVWGPLPPWRRRALLAADGIVSDCEFTRKLLERRFPALSGRIVVVVDCVDVECFTPGPVDPMLRDELALGSRPVVLTVSRLARGRSKGHRVVMDALARLRASGRGFAYVVVGDGDDRSALEAYAQELGVADGVIFAGKVPDDRLPALYRTCDVFVLASGFRLGHRPEGEGVPLVALEAQACGRPVITSRLDGSAESIVDGETGILVDPHDVNEVTAALDRLLSDPALRATMSAAARRLAVEQFAFDVFRSRLCEAIPQLRVA